MFEGSFFKMKSLKNIVCVLLSVFGTISFANAQNVVSPEEATMRSTSSVDWVKSQFSSKIALDIQKAHIQLPSGKSAATKRIEMQLPELIKDPLLTLNVDSSVKLGDMIIHQNLTLEQLTHIIDNSKRTPGVLSTTSNEMLVTNTIKMNEIGSLMVKHNVPYRAQTPIETISSRVYTGIVIDARSILPVHGEYTVESMEPCFFPKIWNEQMDLIYERNMVNRNIASENGIVHYDISDDTPESIKRVGRDPLRITAIEVYGANRTDPVISYDDYLRIMTVPKNRDLLRDGKVVILLDKGMLVHTVGAPDKSGSYYAVYDKLKEFVFEDKTAEFVEIEDVPSGMQITVNDLKFEADSAKLLSDETPRIKALAEQLKMATRDNGFTILIEGHTADVGKPVGQMNLSIERANAIVEALVEQGVKRELLSTRGFGGTVPVGDNSTPEGRALNRRVEIKVMPENTNVQYAK